MLPYPAEGPLRKRYARHLPNYSQISVSRPKVQVFRDRNGNGVTNNRGSSIRTPDNLGSGQNMKLTRMTSYDLQRLDSTANTEFRDADSWFGSDFGTPVGSRGPSRDGSNVTSPTRSQVGDSTRPVDVTQAVERAGRYFTERGLYGNVLRSEALIAARTAAPYAEGLYDAGTDLLTRTKDQVHTDLGEIISSLGSLQPTLEGAAGAVPEIATLVQRLAASGLSSVGDVARAGIRTGGAMAGVGQDAVQLTRQIVTGVAAMGGERAWSLIQTMAQARRERNERAAMEANAEWEFNVARWRREAAIETDAGRPEVQAQVEATRQAELDYFSRSRQNFEREEARRRQAASSQADLQAQTAERLATAAQAEKNKSAKGKGKTRAGTPAPQPQPQPGSESESDDDAVYLDPGAGASELPEVFEQPAPSAPTAIPTPIIPIPIHEAPLSLARFEARLAQGNAAEARAQGTGFYLNPQDDPDPPDYFGRRREQREREREVYQDSLRTFDFRRQQAARAQQQADAARMAALPPRPTHAQYTEMNRRHQTYARAALKAHKHKEGMVQKKKDTKKKEDLKKRTTITIITDRTQPSRKRDRDGDGGAEEVHVTNRQRTE